MTTSTSLTKIAPALIKVQSELKNMPTTEENPFFKSKYTPLDVIIDKSKPLLAANGLTILQTPCSDDHGRIGVVTTLLHASGEFIQGQPFYLKPVKDDPQMAGSAVTYARRYSLAAMLNVASDQDDDGNASSGKNKGPSIGGECKVCGKKVSNEHAVKSKNTNNGIIYCTGTCKDKDTPKNKVNYTGDINGDE